MSRLEVYLFRNHVAAAYLIVKVQTSLPISNRDIETAKAA
jgi:hypothetical protein